MQQKKEHNPSFSFQKKERVCSKITFRKLIEGNLSVFQYPYKCFYYCSPIAEKEDCNALAIAVPKRYFKRAVDRNRIKRLTREAYRLNNKSILFDYTIKQNRKIDVLFVYVGKDILPFKQIENQVVNILKTITSKI